MIRSSGVPTPAPSSPPPRHVALTPQSSCRRSAGQMTPRPLKAGSYTASGTHVPAPPSLAGCSFSVSFMSPPNFPQHLTLEGPRLSSQTSLSVYPRFPGEVIQPVALGPLAGPR